MATATFTNDGKPGTDVVTASLAGSSTVDSASVEITAGAPGRPTIISTAPGDAQVTVKFSPPARDGGAKITSYLVTATDTTHPGTATTSSAAQSPITVTGFVNGDQYSITVHASNSAGPGPESKPATAVPTSCASSRGRRCVRLRALRGLPRAACWHRWRAVLGRATQSSEVPHRRRYGHPQQHEYRTRMVTADVRELLHRPATKAEFAYLLNQRAKGAAPRTLLFTIATSSQFLQHATSVAPACVSRKGDFVVVCTLYEDFLGRAPSARELNGWKNDWPSTVAGVILDSVEYENDRVTADLHELSLGSSAKSLLAYDFTHARFTSQDILATLAGSAAFFSRVSG